jgi:hypothetical protein
MIFGRDGGKVYVIQVRWPCGTLESVDLGGFSGPHALEEASRVAEQFRRFARFVSTADMERLPDILASAPPWVRDTLNEALLVRGVDPTRIAVLIGDAVNENALTAVAEPAVAC